MGSLFYRVLATLIPTKNVAALVGFLNTFTQKLAAAEANQRTIAEDYSAEIAVLANKRDEALTAARRIKKIGQVVTDILD